MAYPLCWYPLAVLTSSCCSRMPSRLRHHPLHLLLLLLQLQGLMPLHQAVLDEQDRVVVVPLREADPLSLVLPLLHEEPVAVLVPILLQVVVLLVLHPALPP